MSATARFSLRPLITVFIVAAAAVIALSSYREITFLSTQIDARQKELARLETMRQETAGQRTPLEWLESNARSEDRIAELIKRHLASVPTDLAMRERREDENGWITQRFDLRIDRIKPNDLSAFLAACENARPPIRLIDIQASAAATPDRQITLQLALAELTRKAAVSTP